MAAVRPPYTVYLFDTSAVARRGVPAIAELIGGAIDRGNAATCPPVVLEIGFSARDAKVLEVRHRWVAPPGSLD